MNNNEWLDQALRWNLTELYANVATACTDDGRFEFQCNVDRDELDARSYLWRVRIRISIGAKDIDVVASERTTSQALGITMCESMVRKLIGLRES